MSNALYATSLGVPTSTFNPNTPVIATIPGFGKTTATYAGQVAPGQSVLLRLSPEVFGSMLKKELDRALRHQLDPKLEELLATRSSRAKPLLQYMDRMGLHESLSSLSEGGHNGTFLDSTDLESIALGISSALGRKQGPTHSSYDPLADDIRFYLETGKADEQTLALLAEKVNPVFGDVLAYNSLSDKYSGTPEAKAILVGPIKAVAYTVQPVFAAVELLECSGGRSEALSPLVYDAEKGAKALPEQIRGTFVSTQQLTRFITVSDVTLCRLMLRCITSEDRLAKERVDVSPGLVMRAIMPENPAILALYPDERVAISGRPDLTAFVKAKAVEYFQDGTMARAAAKHYGLSQAEFSQEAFVGLVEAQNRVMPVLPMEIYHFVEQDVLADKLSRRNEDLEKKFKEKSTDIDLLRYQKSSIASYSIDATKRLFSQHEAIVKNLNTIHNALLAASARLRQDFCVDTDTMTRVDSMILREAVEFFGPEFAFMEKVLLRDLAEISISQK